MATPDPKANRVPPGTVVAGRYEITREIGRGGMAAVYEATHSDIGKRIAIKILSAEYVMSPVVIERFLREARATAAVRSPYICDVYDSGKLDDGRPFLVMELLEGESLYERMVRIRLFDPATTLRIVTHVARGLQKAHDASIVHRDLKPENVFITEDDDGQLVAKILDFGLAKFYAPATEGGAQARLTREGAIFGTPAYMSPEQVQGQGTVDHRADLWALGCITYECLTGRTVWSTDKGIAMTFAQIASAPLPRLTKYRPDLPAEIQGWFERALARRIEERFQTAKELADALADALEDAPAIPSSDSLELVSREPSGALVLHVPVDDDTPAPEIVMPGASAQPAPVRGPSVPSASPSRADAQPSERQPSSLDAGLTLASAPPTPEPPGTEPVPARRGVSAAVLGVVVALAGVGGYFAWAELERGAQPVAPPQRAASSATITPSASAPSSAASATAIPPPPGPKWAQGLAEAQGLLAAGAFDDAQKKVRESFDGSGAGPARTYLEHLSAAKDNKGTCKLKALGRVRPMVFAGGFVGRPVVVGTKAGLVALYVDDHEGGNRVHGYAVELDQALRPRSMPVDVTPEADTVGRLEARAVGGQIAVAYTETRGPRAALYGRWLDGRGRIAGAEFTVGPARAVSPALGAADGLLFVAWDEKQDGEQVDLMLRRVHGTGQLAAPVRLTDLRKVTQKVALPELEALPTSLELVFRLDRGTQRTVQYLHVPIESDGPTTGVPANPKGRDDKVLGTMRGLSNPTERVDTPDLACFAEGCFVVWHVEKPPQGGGAYAAFIDPKLGTMLWRKKFAQSGGRPSVAIAQGGVGRVAWFEGGRLKTATITRDGVAAPSVLARVVGDQPPPSIVAGDEAHAWAISWLDFEAGKLEPYAVRAVCPP